MPEENNQQTNNDSSASFRRNDRFTPRPIDRSNFQRPVRRESFIDGEIRQRLIQSPKPPSEQPQTYQPPEPQVPVEPHHHEPEPMHHPNNYPLQTVTIIEPSDLHMDLDNSIDDLFPLQPARTVPRQSSAPLIKKVHYLPLGIYLLSGFSTVLLIASILNTSNTKFAYIALTAVQLLVMIGFLIKNSFPRKILKPLTILSIVAVIGLSDLFIFQYIKLNHKYHNNFNEIKSKSAQLLSSREKSDLATTQANVIASRDGFIRASKLFYGLNGGIVVFDAVLLIYMSRDSVKEGLKKRPKQSEQLPIAQV